MRIRFTGSMSIAAAVLALTLAGCSSDANEGGDAPDNGDSSISVAFAGSAASFDPVKQTNPAEYSYMGMIYDSLTRVSADGNEIEPRLATEWSFAEDGTSLELKLRDDVTFHDGTPFNAEAVKANIERGQQTEGSTVAAALSAITGVEVVDDSTVRLMLKGGGAQLPAMFANTAGMMVSPAAIEEGRDLTLEPGDAGSGPYLISEFKPGESVAYERADEYWDDSVEDRPATMTVALVAETASRMNGVLAGQYDVGQITGIDVPQARDLVDSGQVEGYARIARTAFWVFMNTTKPPLDNIKIRQAINYAIDRQAIGESLYSNACHPSYQVYPEGYFAFDPSMEGKYDFDLDEAKKLVSGSGVSNPTITLEVGSLSAYEPAAQALQEQLGKVGIKVNLSPIPQADVFVKITEGTAQAALTGVIGGADPSVWVNNYFLGGADLLRGNEELKAEVADLASQATVPTADAEQRGELYRQIQNLVSDEAVYAQICSSEHLWIHNDKVENVDENWTGIWTGQPDFAQLAKTS